MKPALLLALFAGLVLLACFNMVPHLPGLFGDRQFAAPPLAAASGSGLPDSGGASPGLVLEVSVHSLDELRVLLRDQMSWQVKQA